ncbi:MAG: hypothetical protein L6Q71_01770 [Planctomycetes bacterium]|nr:hypothetical protein [Planctomycetota bacterium]NUQ35836.1 hypothetical protein [Planctomycetaceae bacterium]
MDLVWVGYEQGFEYRIVYARAWRGDLDSLATILQYQPGGNAAAADGHCWYLGKLLFHLGDGQFAGVLRTLPQSVQSAITGCLEYELTNAEMDCSLGENALFRQSYPLTYEICLSSYARS